MVVKCADFKPEQFFKDVPLLKNRRGNPSGKKRRYIGICTAFDIETTLLPEINQSIMYIWQWQIGIGITVIGRTWDEFSDLLTRIKSSLPADRWLVVYVHNLGYELQFLKAVYSFQPEEVFAVASRKPIKADMMNCFEFRCSYKLTNMSLDEFTKKMGVEHEKLSGEKFDYSKQRFPWTELTEYELQYCINDVQGLVEAITNLMNRDGDTLQTIPLTSTGYVRRNAKRAMRDGIQHNFVHSILPDYELYKALREAFRGGNTHCNRFFTGDIVSEVHSADRSSSYPAVMCNCEYPMTQFIPILPSDLNLEYVARCITIRHKAVLLRIRMHHVRLKDPYWGCPYLASSKCRECRGLVLVTDKDEISSIDNGRILRADSLVTTVTDIDLQIILSEYDGDVEILQGWYASYKKLPQPLITEVIQYYRDKTALKNVSGQELYYDKAKSLLNSLYGMMAQASVKPEITFEQVGDWDDAISKVRNNIQLSDEEKTAMIVTIEKMLLEKYNQKAFLAYQWGVWVTAHARNELEKGIRLVHETKGAHFIYCDTDSVKYSGSVDFSGYNRQCVSDCTDSGAFATDPAGITHYMGVYESEDNPETGYAYYKFKSLGAKKYAFQRKPGSGTECTIAGVTKSKGGEELDKHGGLDAFEDGFVFRDAGGTEAVYNDEPPISEIEIDGHKLRITPNIAIRQSEYTLGITGEYEKILRYAKNYLLNPYVV